MNKQEELDSILFVLRSFSNGASLEELNKALTISIERRSLQRRLKKLKEDNLIYTEGGSHAIRYFFKDTAASQSKIATTGDSLMTPPLSPKGKDVWTLVSRPEVQRKPFGYQQDFTVPISTATSAKKKNKNWQNGEKQGKKNNRPEPMPERF
jgi:hypothetical protein